MAYYPHSSLIVLCLSSLLSCSYATNTTIPANDKIAYVFEIVRHGARAPLLDEAGQFDVPYGNLTEEGMRQRYLLGKMERKKYIEDYKVIDDQYAPEQFYIQSTDIFRTLQSSYSELLGIFPPGTGQQDLSQGELKSLQSGKGMPPMKIRAGLALNEQLGSNAIIDGIVQVPVFTYTDITFDDDINIGGCSYVQNVDSYYYVNPDTFDEQMKTFGPMLKTPFMVQFNLTEEQYDAFVYTDLYSYTDILVSEQFQGIPQKYNFSLEEWFYVENTQKWALINTFTEYSRQIMDPKLLRTPLKKMDETVKAFLNHTNSKKDLKYFIYSAHDMQIANLLEFLNFTDFDYYQVPYCSQVYFELHYDQVCMDTVGDSSCFSIQIRFNGVPLQFESCDKIDLINGEEKSLYAYPYHCSYDSFVEYLNKKRLEGTFEDLCHQTFTPPVFK